MFVFLGGGSIPAIDHMKKMALTFTRLQRDKYINHQFIGLDIIIALVTVFVFTT